MLPPGSGLAWARAGPCIEFQCRTTGPPAGSKAVPVTLTLLPGLPEGVLAVIVARLVQAKTPPAPITSAARTPPPAAATLARNLILGPPSFLMHGFAAR